MNVIKNKLYNIVLSFYKINSLFNDFTTIKYCFEDVVNNFNEIEINKSKMEVYNSTSLVQNVEWPAQHAHIWPPYLHPFTCRGGSYMSCIFPREWHPRA